MKKTATFVLLATANAIVNIAAIYWYWRWFVVPAAGWRALGVREAISIDVMLSLFSWWLYSPQDIPWDRTVKQAAGKIIGTCVMIGYGWLAHLLLWGLQ